MHRFYTKLNDIGVFESNTNFYGMLSELLLWNNGIIKVPEGADYNQYAATSSNNSIESAELVFNQIALYKP
ncbi:MAG: hypothetical protein ACE5KT_07170 [Methanosarcinales archaeon]